jgi:hypothetical protein
VRRETDSKNKGKKLREVMEERAEDAAVSGKGWGEFE